MSCQYIGGAYVRACDVTVPSRTPILSLVDSKKHRKCSLCLPARLLVLAGIPVAAPVRMYEHVTLARHNVCIRYINSKPAPPSLRKLPLRPRRRRCSDAAPRRGRGRRRRRLHRPRRRRRRGRLPLPLPTGHLRLRLRLCHERSFGGGAPVSVSAPSVPRGNRRCRRDAAGRQQEEAAPGQADHQGGGAGDEDAIQPPQEAVAGMEAARGRRRRRKRRGGGRGRGPTGRRRIRPPFRPRGVPPPQRPVGLRRADRPAPDLPRRHFGGGAGGSPSGVAGGGGLLRAGRRRPEPDAPAGEEPGPGPVGLR